VSPQYGPFVPVAIPNGVPWTTWTTPVRAGSPRRHYAFLVSRRLRRDLGGSGRRAHYWRTGASPRGEINTNDGGRGRTSTTRTATPGDPDAADGTGSPGSLGEERLAGPVGPYEPSRPRCRWAVRNGRVPARTHGRAVRRHLDQGVLVDGDAVGSRCRRRRRSASNVPLAPRARPPRRTRARAFPYVDLVQVSAVVLRAHRTPSSNHPPRRPTVRRGGTAENPAVRNAPLGERRATGRDSRRRRPDRRGSAHRTRAARRPPRPPRVEPPTDRHEHRTGVQSAALLNTAS